MGTLEKLVKKIKSKPKNFTWNELVKLLKHLGYQESNCGKTSGSRKRFIRENAQVILLHKPHPGNELKQYQIKQVLETLKEEGLL